MNADSAFRADSALTGLLPDGRFVLLSGRVQDGLTGVYFGDRLDVLAAKYPGIHSPPGDLTRHVLWSPVHCWATLDNVRYVIVAHPAVLEQFGIINDATSYCCVSAFELVAGVLKVRMRRRKRTDYGVLFRYEESSTLGKAILGFAAHHPSATYHFSFGLTHRLRSRAW